MDIKELEKVYGLKEKGVLTEDEFIKIKEKYLGISETESKEIEQYEKKENNNKEIKQYIMQKNEKINNIEAEKKEIKRKNKLVYLLLICAFICVGIVIIDSLEDLYNAGRVTDNKGSQITTKEKQNNEHIKRVEKIIQDNTSIEKGIFFKDSANGTILGETADFILKGTYDTTLDIRVKKKGTSIEINPIAGYLETQEFHFYTDGTLAAYISRSSSIQSFQKYYFFNNKLITKFQENELGTDIEYEDEKEILKRASKIYERYITNEQNFEGIKIDESITDLEIKWGNYLNPEVSIKAYEEYCKTETHGEYYSFMMAGTCMLNGVICDVIQAGTPDSMNEYIIVDTSKRYRKSYYL